MSVKKNFTVQNELNTAVEHADKEQTEQKRRKGDKWTKNLVTLEAAKFQNRSEFKESSNGAYRHSLRNKYIDEIFPPKTKKWCKKSAIRAALQCATISEFDDRFRGAKAFLDRNNIPIPIDVKQPAKLFYLDNVEALKLDCLKFDSITQLNKHNKPAYNACRELGIVDDIFQRKIKRNGSWTIEAIKAEAAKHSSFKSFMSNSNGAYSASLKTKVHSKLMCELFSMDPPKRWGDIEIIEEAKKYQSRSEFQYRSGGAHNAAKRLGIYDKCCEHMKRKSTLKDIIYIWRCIARDYPDNVFKIGVTSSELSYKSRFNYVTSSLGVSGCDYFEFNAGRFALKLERDLLSLGTKFNGASGNGSTELRILSPTELKQILEIMKNARSIQ